MRSFTFLLYSCFSFGLSITAGSIGFSSSLGSSIFSTVFFVGGSFLIFAAEGGRSIFFFPYCFTSAYYDPPPLKIFFTYGSEGCPLVAHRCIDWSIAFVNSGSRPAIIFCGLAGILFPSIISAKVMILVR